MNTDEGGEVTILEIEFGTGLATEEQAPSLAELPFVTGDEKASAGLQVIIASRDRKIRPDAHAAFELVIAALCINRTKKSLADSSPERKNPGHAPRPNRYL